MEIPFEDVAVLVGNARLGLQLSAERVLQVIDRVETALRTEQERVQHQPEIELEAQE